MDKPQVDELERLSYSIPRFAAAVDISVQSVRNAIAAGELVPSYFNAKPLISREEGVRWLRSLPAERRAS